MLTSELLRVAVRKQKVKPRYLDAEDARATGLALTVVSRRQ